MLFKLIWQTIKKHKISVFLILFFQLLQTIIGLFLPKLNADIIDNGVVKTDLPYIWKIGIIMIAITLFQGICAGISVFSSAKVSMKVGQDLRRRLFKTVSGYSPSDIHKFGPATLITRTTNDVTQVQNVTFMGTTILVVAPIMGVGGVIMALWQNVTLSLVILVTVPILTAVILILMKKLGPLFKKQQLQTDRTNLVLREQLSGVRVIRAFHREPTEKSRFEVANTNLKNTNLKVGYLFAFMNPSISIIISASNLAVIWFGADLINNNSMQVGSLLAFLSYLMQIMFSVLMASFVFMFVPRASVSAKRINEVLEVSSSISSPENAAPMPAGDLTFKTTAMEVRFGLAAEPVLTGLDITLNPGKTVAVIGATGSGKTTLANVFGRINDPTIGAVTVEGSDGHALDLRQVDLRQLREKVAYVPQKAYLFKGTVASNVSCVPVDQVTDQVRKQVQKALEIADAAEFISQRPDTLDAEVDAGGTGFSGGQRQRLTIARAVYSVLYGPGPAQLLIIDDAFSALDLATDAKVRGALKRELPVNTSKLIVAQRVSTIMDADEIIVLENGTICGRGTHDELLENCDVYAQIVSSQLKENTAA